MDFYIDPGNPHDSANTVQSTMPVLVALALFSMEMM